MIFLIVSHLGLCHQCISVPLVLLSNAQNAQVETLQDPLCAAVVVFVASHQQRAAE